MAASRIYDTWAWTNFTVTPYRWLKSQITFLSNMVDWLVVCKVPRKDVLYNVDDEQVYRDYLYLVGKPAVIPPSPITNTVSTSFISGDSYGYDLGQSFAGLYPNNYIERNGYIIWGGSDGNGGLIGDADYEYDTPEDFYDAIDNGDIVSVKPDVYFDVYINGDNKPSIYVNWTASEDIPIAELVPHVWIGCQSLITVVSDITGESGYNVPNLAAWNVDSAGEMSYAGSYSNTYLSIQQHFEQYLNAVSKLERWGVNGEPEYVRLYLRMDTVTNGFGELARVQINKEGTGSYEMIPGSASNDTFNTHIRLHYGEPDYVPPEDPEDYPGGTNIDDDGPGRYDPDNIPDPADFTDPVGFDGNAVLTRTYAVSAATLENIGQKLWSQSYFNVLKIQTNPIENIISLKHFPFASNTGTTENVKVGDIDFGVNGLKVRSVWTKTFSSYKYTGKYKNYLDFAPFTQIKINLPYIGLIQLDPADLFGSTLSVKYYVDLVTGQCMAKLFLDEDHDTQKAMPYMSVYGQMGVDIPLTATDRVQTEMKALSAGISAFGGMGMQLMHGNTGGAIAGATSDALSILSADVTSQRTSTLSPACASYDVQDVFILIQRPAAEYVNADAVTGYKHLHGMPCNKYLALSSFNSGDFVQMDRRTDIKIAMTSEENRMLEQLLTAGVYI